MLTQNCSRLTRGVVFSHAIDFASDRLIVILKVKGIIMKRIIVLAPLCVVLASCGGGGASNTFSSFVRPSVSGTTPTNIINNGISNEANYTSGSGVIRVSDLQKGQTGAQASIRYDANDDFSTLTLTTAGGVTLSWAAATDSGALTPTERQNFTRLINPFTLGWRYQTFGIWASSRLDKIGGYSIGAPTSGSGVPTAGSALYRGQTLGLYNDASGDGRVTASNLMAQANYASRTIAVSSSGTVYTSDSTPNNDLNFSGAMSYSAAANDLTGSFTTTSGLNGTMKGQFYGPAAEELGGTFSTNNAGLQVYLGAFGAKK